MFSSPFLLLGNCLFNSGNSDGPDWKRKKVCCWLSSFQQHDNKYYINVVKCGASFFLFRVLGLSGGGGIPSETPRHTECHMMMSPCHLPHCWENAWRGVGAGRDIMRSCVRTVAKPVHPRSPFFPPQHQPSAGVFGGGRARIYVVSHMAPPELPSSRWCRIKGSAHINTLSRASSHIHKTHIRVSPSREAA